MKKVFKFFYIENRKIIVFSLISLYMILAISLSTTLADEKYKTVINIVQLLLGGILFTFVIADVILQKTKNLFLLAFLLILSLLTLYFAKNTLLLALFVFILVLKEYKFEEIIKCFYIILVVELFVIILLAVTNIIPNLVHYREDTVRYTLGFKTATLSQTIFMFITLAGAYIWREKHRIDIIILEMLVATLLYILTDSRLGFFMSIGILTLLLIIKICSKFLDFSKLKINKNISRFFKFILVISPFLCLIFCLILTFAFKTQSSFILKLNKMVSARIVYAYDAFKNYQLSPFGKIINWFADEKYIGVDCSFLFYIFDIGVVNSLVVFVLLSYLIYKTIKNNDNWLLLFLIICLGCGMVEPYLIDYKYNLFVYSFVLLFQKDREQANITNEIIKEKFSSNMNDKLLKQVCVVVVTYNRKTLLRESLLALKSQDYKNFKILIIDNASTDGTNEFISDLLDENVFYYNTEKNLGGAGGFNFGLRQAVLLGTDYIWAMDDDCIVQNNSLLELVKFAEQVRDDFGYLSSKVLWTDATPCNMNIQKVNFRQKVDVNATQAVKIELASFVSFFVRREVVEDVGLPIKDFFIWGDDFEYTNRISKKYPCYFVPSSVVTHKSLANIGSNIVKDKSENLERYKYAYRNECYMYRQNGLKGRCYLTAKKWLHTFKVLFSKISEKKKRIKIIHSNIKNGFKFNPKIEYVYNEKTDVNVLEFFGEPLAYGGQEAFMINMYKNFDSKNIHYTFCTPFELTNKTLIELTEQRNDKIVHFDYNFNSKLRKIYIKRAIKRVLRENKFEVIHIQSGSIFTLLSVAKIAKKYGVKRVIVHSHSTGNNNFKYRLIKHFSDKKIEKYVDEFFACSKLAGSWKFPKNVVNGNHFSVINNGIDTSRFTFNEETRKNYRQKLGLNAKFTLLNVGRFDGMKNHKFMVGLANELSKKGIDFKFILVGEGELKEEIISQINGLNLTNYFVFLEKRNDIAEIMMASDVFVLPSLFEGLPVVAVEAQTTGLVSLCSDKITDEVGISEICEFLELDVNVWSNRVINLQNNIIDRKKYAEIIKNAGYDARYSAKVLENKYLCK